MIPSRHFRAPLGRFWCCAWLIFAISGLALAQQPPSDLPPSSPNVKPKKVWTNDNLQPSAAEPAADRVTRPPASPTKDANTQLARDLRSKLEKLGPQLKDIEKQLDELKRFQAGETDGSSGRQFNKGYNRTPIATQIEKLETKHRQLQAQISAIYDEARQKGIPPGQLR